MKIRVRRDEDGEYVDSDELTNCLSGFGREVTIRRLWREYVLAEGASGKGIWREISAEARLGMETASAEARAILMELAEEYGDERARRKLARNLPEYRRPGEAEEFAQQREREANMMTRLYRGLYRGE